MDAQPGPRHSVQALLPLKLTPPQLRAGVLLRPHLQELLAEVRLHPLTLLIAPAGYGKTTLLTQWIRELTHTGSPVAWVALDQGERDPSMFLAYIIQTLQQIIPGVGENAWRALNSVANLERDWPLVAGALCGDLQRRVVTSTFLFLDDIHLAVESAVISQIVTYLLRAAPPSLHIVLASRRPLILTPLARLRAEGRLLELSQQDLYLSDEDIRQILSTQVVELSDEDLEILRQRTAGWALSVQLAARALASQPPERREAFVQTLSGSQEQLLQYLSSEVLTDLPQELLSFLQQAAIPPYIEPQLLADVLERDDVDYLLGRAQALGLPLQPIDWHGDRLRFHPLWREQLLRDAVAQIPAATLHALRWRFGQAFEARGDLDAAIEQYAATGATAELTRALRDHAWLLVRSPQRDRVRNWLAQLPKSQREADPELLYMWGVSHIYTDSEKAATILQRAVSQFAERNLASRQVAVLSDLAALAIWQFHLGTLRDICQQAIRAAQQAQDSWSRGIMLVCGAIISTTRGRYQLALRMMRRAESRPIPVAWRWLMAITCADVACLLGQPTEAQRIVDQVLPLREIDQDERLRQPLLALRGIAIFEQGSINEGIALATEAHQHISDYHQSGIAGFSASRFAFLLALQGRIDEANTYVSRARAIFHPAGLQSQLLHVQAIEAYILLQSDQVVIARTLVDGMLRRFREPHMQMDLRTWLLVAIVLGESGESQRAEGLLREIVPLMRRQGYCLFLVSAQLYLAVLTKDSEARDALLREGWNLAEARQFTFLPCILPIALRTAITEGLSLGLAQQTIGKVLQTQLAEQASGILLELLRHPQAEVRIAATALLGDLHAAEAYAALRGLLKDQQAGVRKAAELALEHLAYRPPYILRIRTLGAFSVWRGETEVKDREWRSGKARQFFQFLLTEIGRSVPRDRVMELLWPDMVGTDLAYNNLRVTLNRLSKAIEPDRPEGMPSSYIIQQNDTYSFNIESDYELDTVAFAEAVAEGQRAVRAGQRQAAITAFRRAVDLYGGQYLPDTLYEDWSVVERERLLMLFTDAAMHLGRLLLEEGKTHEALGLGWRVLEQDQTNEEAYRLLIRSHAELGERSTALRIFARCVSTLEQELGVKPMAETVQLVEGIRALP